MQHATPETRPSDAVTNRGAVPAVSVGAASGEADTLGPVASYFRLAEPAALVLPALSVHVPETETLVPSGPL